MSPRGRGDLKDFNLGEMKRGKRNGGTCERKRKKQEDEGKMRLK
jgi:hypothetical protein